MKGNFKTPEEQRSRKIIVRFTEAEYDAITSGAKNAGMSLSSYVRHLAVNAKIDINYKLSYDSSILGPILGQLGKIGSNLNQIARYYNRGGQPSGGIEQRISECLSELFVIREKLSEL